MNNLDFLGSDIRSVDPKIRLIVEIGADFESIQVSYDFLYDTVRVHPNSIKKAIEYEDSFILRDIQKESLLITGISSLFDLADIY